jgi:hypothetical protein
MPLKGERQTACPDAVPDQKTTKPHDWLVHMGVTRDALAAMASNRNSRECAERECNSDERGLKKDPASWRKHARYGRRIEI